MRFLPVATVVTARSFGLSSPSWAFAAEIHGLSLFGYLRRILIPWMLPGLLLGTFLIALLATAEVGPVLLLRPPGEDSLPVALFTVMANAPEAQVSALCFVYLATAAFLIGGGWAVARRKEA
jgi:ABC-type Fe3+ transport system permease subunit